MGIYALSDLHLYKSIKDKPMDIFGPEWDNHMSKLENGCKILTDEDTLLIPGDISWAMYLKEAYEDLKFINELPGKKIISKGNHDYWWESHKKLKSFIEENNFNTISFLHNNYFPVNDIAVCGNKGYTYNSMGYVENPTESAAHDKLLYEREISRMELSLSMAGKDGFNRKIFQTHFPPFESGRLPSERIQEIFEKYQVEICIYGHLHSGSRKNIFEGKFGCTEYVFVSCEHLDFTPKLIIK